MRTRIHTDKEARITTDYPRPSVNKNPWASVIKKLFFILLCVAFFASYTYAQDVPPANRLVTAIKVENNKSVSTINILSKIRTREGDILSQDTLNDDLKRLYNTGYFTDVRIDMKDYKEGVAVTFFVTEKPFLTDIKFEGNKAFRKERFKELVKSKTNEFLDRRQLATDINELRSFYVKRGYNDVKIDYRLDVDKDSNEAVATISIQEGLVFRIRNISVEGNRNFTDRTILKLLKTRLKGLFSTGYLKEDVIREDIERILKFYQDAGFINVKASYELRRDEAHRRVYLVINVDEGNKYIVGRLEILGAKVFTEDEIRRSMRLVSGDVFSTDMLKADVSAIQSLYFAKGYITASVDVDTHLGETQPVVDIRFEITEGEVAYVDKIKIRGNIKTKDIVVRRELRLKPGDKFDGDKLKRSRERLDNLGFFEELSFDTEPGGQPNTRDLIVTVKEAKTGEFSFGGGFSSIDKLIGFVELTQKNFDIGNFPTFTGAGQEMKLRTEFGTIRQDYELSFTEPWIFGRPLAFGFDLYSRTRERSRDLGYGFDEERRGGDIRLGKEFGEYMRGDLMYRLEAVNISNIIESASSDFKQEEGKNTISSFSLGLARDTRDSKASPTQGYTLSGTLEVAGGPFGGDKDFAKEILTSSLYFEHFDIFVLELRGRAGIVDAIASSNRVPIYERFFVGGANTIRGFEEREIGPKDTATQDPIGGESMLVANAEEIFPIAPGLKGALFFDVGNAWARANELGQGNYRAGSGLGVRIKTPFGPVKLDYGIPVLTQTGDEKRGRFHFNVSRGF